MAGELHHFQNLRYVAISDNSNASSRFGRRLVGLAIKCSKAILRVRHGYGASQNVPLKNTGILKCELCCPQEANRTRSAVDITAAEMVAREHGDSAANKCVAWIFEMSGTRINVVFVGLRGYRCYAPSSGCAFNLCDSQGKNSVQEGSLGKVRSHNGLGWFAILDQMMITGEMAIRSRNKIDKLLVLPGWRWLSSPWFELPARWEESAGGTAPCKVVCSWLVCWL